jgi:PAS domain S-box-containing protein
MISSPDVPEHLRVIVETARDAIIAASEHGTITFCNRATETLFGYAAGALIGSVLTQLMPDRFHDAHRAGMARFLRTGDPHVIGGTVELLGLHQDGGEFPIELSLSSGTANGETFFIGIIRDIRARKLAEQEARLAEERLRRSEAQLRQAQEIAQIGSWEWDLATDIVTPSDQLCAIRGIARTPSLPADRFYDGIHPEDRERVREGFQRCLQDASGSTCDYRIVRGDGVRHVQTRGELVPGPDGTARMIGTEQDVTEKRLVEARIMLGDRLTSVGTLAAGVAHEINNPLAYVSMNLDLIAEEIRSIGGASPSGRLRELDELTREARQGAERVRKIVSGLKTFSRADSERRVILDVHQVLDLALNMSFNEIRHRARLAKDYGEAPAVEADESRLGQVFVNLLVNAAHAIPEGQADRNEIRIVTRAEGERAIIEVRDTGSGIPANVLGRIFDPFFTTKPVGVGTGLGLSISHSIVTELGGEITVHSEVGKGTTFRVALPGTRAHAASDAAENAGAGRTIRVGRVLIVDDDELGARSLSRVLRPHDVTIKHDGRQALEAIRAGKQFDAILCDLMMPEMTGMDLHRELAREQPHLVEKMIFMTGGAFTPAAREFLGRVPNDRLEKPCTPQAVRALVQRLLD